MEVLNINQNPLAISEDEEIVLNPRQEEFCYLYVNAPKLKGNATRCYMQAYGKENESAAAVDAAKLLMNPKVQRRVRQYLVSSGFHPEGLDLSLNELIKGTNKKIRLEAIKEANRLHGRIIGKNQNVHVDANRLLDQMKEAGEAEYG